MRQDRVVTKEAKLVVDVCVGLGRGKEGLGRVRNLQHNLLLTSCLGSPRAKVTSLGFSARCVWSGSEGSLAIMSPRSVRTCSEQEMANRGVKIGWTRFVDSLEGLLSTTSPLVDGDTQRSLTNNTNSRVSARLDSAYSVAFVRVRSTFCS